MPTLFLVRVCCDAKHARASAWNSKELSDCCSTKTCLEALASCPGYALVNVGLQWVPVQTTAPVPS